MTPRLGRRFALVGLGAALLALAPSLPAFAAPADVTVVLTLRPANPAALAAATRYPARATTAQRRSALAAARPSPSRTGRVTTYLASHGFTVTENDGWTLTARGPEPAAASLRAALPDDVASVGGLGRQHAWRHTSIPVGWTAAPLRAAYDLASGDGTGLSIATVQFSGWHSGDLSTYTAAAGIATPSVTQVVVGTGDPTDTSSGGDTEVALDQEVLAATAPKAAQRIYFAGNTTAQAVQLYSRIATDAEAGLVDVVSASWGMCEAFADWDPQSRDGMETALARIVAAGATVFAASGDDGAYDCGDGTLAVDYPAASAYVVGVGGTTLTDSTSGWTETAWNDAGHGWGGGGGESSSVPRPSWQSGLGTGTHRLVPDVSAMADPYTGFGTYTTAYGWRVFGGTSAASPLVAGHLASALSAAGRSSGVGDIHAAIYANPAAFRDVTSGTNLYWSASAGYDRASGLGTPQWSRLSAVLFGNPVVSAPAGTRTLTVPVTVTPPASTTVTAWTAAEGTTVACDAGGSPLPPTSVTLAAGSDRATHVAVGALDTNGACHVGTAPVVLDTHVPVATGSIRAYAADARTAIAWGATDSAPSSGIASYDVCVYALGSGCAWRAPATTARSVTLTLSQGWTYVVRVAARDRAGNRSATYSTVRYTVPVDEKAFTFSSGWSRASSTSDWYGTHTASATRGAAMSRSLTGSSYSLYYVAGPNGGVADVYVNGVLVKQVSMYASTRSYRRLATLAVFATRGARTVRIVVHGTHDARSSGNVVSVDAVRVAF